MLFLKQQLKPFGSKNQNRKLDQQTRMKSLQKINQKKSRCPKNGGIDNKLKYKTLRG